MKRAPIAAAVVALVVYAVLGAIEFFDMEDTGHDARDTGPGWRR